VQISAALVATAAVARDFPRDRLAEVAVVGRSNVGKSSLINALVRQKVARTSSAPGKTRLANFYRVQRGAAPPFYIVDLPGYGYARRVRPPRGGAAGERPFGDITGDYFARWEAGAPDAPRSGAVVLLIDARHPGLDADVDAWTWLGSLGCARAVVGTKADKLTRAQRVQRARELESVFDVPVPLVSATTGEGLDELWKLIARLPNPRTAA
jgi:GTP-binding protein